MVLPKATLSQFWVRIEKVLLRFIGLNIISALITRLRQACLHPELLLKAGSNESEVIKKMVAKWMAKGGSDEAAARVLEEHNTGGEELQPICMYCNDVNTYLSLSEARLSSCL